MLLVVYLRYFQFFSILKWEHFLCRKKNSNFILNNCVKFFWKIFGHFYLKTYLVYRIITYNTRNRIKSPPELVPQIVREMERKF